MVIDLKNTDIWMVDGNTKTGAVNLMAGYIAGATSIVVDGFTGVIPVGAIFLVDGKGVYTVTSTVETTGNTTTINFTPGLYAAATDNDVVTVYGEAIRMKVGEGTITWSEKKPRQYIKDRGLLDTVRDADEEPMDVSFTLQYEFITGTSSDPPTPEDVLKRKGEAAAWVSAANADDPCAPYCVNLMLLHAPPVCTSIDKELTTIHRFYYEQLDHDPKAGTIQVTGKSNALEATSVRIPRT